MPTLTIVRGLPGAGKSTYAEKVLKAKIIHEADDWFLKPTGYEFCIQELNNAHDFCRLNTIYDLNHGHDVVVCNTFTQGWEFEAYLPLIKKHSTTVITLHTQYGNIHNVPEQTLKKMKERFQGRQEIEAYLGVYFDRWVEIS